MGSLLQFVDLMLGQNGLQEYTHAHELYCITAWIIPSIWKSFTGIQQLLKPATDSQLG